MKSNRPVHERGRRVIGAVMKRTLLLLSSVIDSVSGEGNSKGDASMPIKSTLAQYRAIDLTQVPAGAHVIVR